MREKAFGMIEQGSVEGRKTKGFSGLFIMRSMDDPDTGYVLSMWDSEESLDAAFDGIIKQIRGSISDMVTGPPEMKRLDAREIVAMKMTMPA
ncbi:MAG: antibiotic biosynthesis monooxygenase [Methanomassiliicoccales archaeon]|nr:antibiotic biosynthesis monooxygenase [Methanomassiliicoccales archaeon]